LLIVHFLPRGRKDGRVKSPVSLKREGIHLLIWRLNKPTAVIPAEAGVFLQTPAALEEIPACEAE
jgi:hypothetical protein